MPGAPAVPMHAKQKLAVFQSQGNGALAEQKVPVRTLHSLLTCSLQAFMETLAAHADKHKYGLSWAIFLERT